MITMDLEAAQPWSPGLLLARLGQSLIRLFAMVGLVWLIAVVPTADRLGSACGGATDDAGDATGVGTSA